MTLRPGIIIGWICALLVAAFNLFAAVMKLFAPVPPGSPAEEMMKKLGMEGLMVQLGVLELLIAILFMIPRTSTVGFVLMVGYLGGALATILTHGFGTADTVPMYVSLFLLTVSAYFRNPELLSRLLGRSVPEKVYIKAEHKI